MVNREEGDAILHKMPAFRCMTVLMFGVLGVRFLGFLPCYRFVLLCHHIDREQTPDESEQAHPYKNVIRPVSYTHLTLPTNSEV